MVGRGAGCGHGRLPLPSPLPAPPLAAPAWTAGSRRHTESRQRAGSDAAAWRDDATPARDGGGEAARRRRGARDCNKGPCQSSGIKHLNRPHPQAQLSSLQLPFPFSRPPPNQRRPCSGLPHHHHHYHSHRTVQSSTPAAHSSTHTHHTHHTHIHTPHTHTHPLPLPIIDHRCTQPPSIAVRVCACCRSAQAASQLPLIPCSRAPRLATRTTTNASAPPLCDSNRVRTHSSAATTYLVRHVTRGRFSLRYIIPCAPRTVFSFLSRQATRQPVRPSTSPTTLHRRVHAHVPPWYIDGLWPFRPVACASFRQSLTSHHQHYHRTLYTTSHRRAHSPSLSWPYGSNDITSGPQSNCLCANRRHDTRYQYQDEWVSDRLYAASHRPPLTLRMH